MLRILDVLTKEDKRAEEFWVEQTFVKIPRVLKPNSFLDLIPRAERRLSGKTIAVPRMFIGGHDAKAKPTVVSQDVIDLWQQARKDLEGVGATVIETDFPLVTNYEDDSVTGQANNVVGFKPDWNGKERGELVAYLWDDFLKDNGDPNYPGLSAVDGGQVFPRPEGYIPDRYMEHKNFMNYPGLVEIALNRNGKSIWDIDGIAEALPALEVQRKRDLEDWMDEHTIDVVVFPANGDVGKSDLEYNDESARHALQNGVKYSNGNRAIRHMGVPTVSVCMGVMQQSRMPINLTFAGKHGQDSELLMYAYAFEQYTKRRQKPPVTPSIETDQIPDKKRDIKETGQNVSAPRLTVTSQKRTSENSVQVYGHVECDDMESVQLQAFIDGKAVSRNAITLTGQDWSVVADFVPFEPPKPLYGGVGLVVGNVNVIILAWSQGLVAGKLVSIGT